MAWELAQSIEGMAQACEALGLPIVSGNVSLYNDTDGRSIHPTPVGRVRRARRRRPPRAGRVAGGRRDPARGGGHDSALPGSEYQARYGESSRAGRPPLDLAAEAALVRFLGRMAPRLLARPRRLRRRARGRARRGWRSTRASGARLDLPDDDGDALRRGRRPGDRWRCAPTRWRSTRSAPTRRPPHRRGRRRLACSGCRWTISDSRRGGAADVRRLRHPLPERDVARLAYFGLYALQHRGQESAGIATCEGGRLTTLRDIGLVSQVFDEQKLRALPGRDGDRPRPLLDHRRRPGRTRSRSSTTAAPARSRSPTTATSPTRSSSATSWRRRHRGSRHLRLRDHRRAARPATQRPHRGRGRRRRCRGSRAPTRPSADDEARSSPSATRTGSGRSALGRLGDDCVVASESCALRHHRRRAVREVQPGEMVSSTQAGLETRPGACRRARGALCVFEHIYFSRPDSPARGHEAAGGAGRMGEILARGGAGRRRPGDRRPGLRQAGRDRLRARLRPPARRRPDQEPLRRRAPSSSPARSCASTGCGMKFNPLAEIVAASASSSSTTRSCAATRPARSSDAARRGRAEVHLRISAPPIVSPCLYGIDMADEDEIAAAHRSVEEIASTIGADSLAYLSLDGMQAATRCPADSVCRACFTRELPDPDPGAPQPREAPLRAGAGRGAVAAGTSLKTEARAGAGGQAVSDTPVGSAQHTLAAGDTSFRGSARTARTFCVGKPTHSRHDSPLTAVGVCHLGCTAVVLGRAPSSSRGSLDA